MTVYITVNLDTLDARHFNFLSDVIIHIEETTGPISTDINLIDRAIKEKGRIDIAEGWSIQSP